MISRRQFFALSAVTAIAACSSDDAASPSTTGAPTTSTVASTSPATTETAATDVAPTTTQAPTTTAAPTTTTMSIDEIAKAYTETGPHPIGVTTIALPAGNAVEVWYPAADGTVTGEISYDVRDYTPEAIKAILTADVPATFSFDGARDAVVADGSFPLIVFSHGFSGFRLQSSFLTAHLASWGFVVAAPDHPARDLSHVLDGSAESITSDPVEELLATVDLLLAANDAGASLLGGHVDGRTAVAVGHSAGGGTIVGAALDDRISGYVSLASGVQVGGNGTDPVLPDKPSFFLAGALDQVISEVRTTESYQAVPVPTRLWAIDSMGHNGFDDFCTFGDGKGIIGIAEASGLGEYLNSQPQLKSLGEDGCLPPAVPVEETFPIVRHAVVSWIRNHLGIDAEPVGLSPDVAGSYPVRIRIEERLV